MKQSTAHLLLGGNMGDRTALLRAATVALAERCGPLQRASSLYETAAWGYEDQAPFLNQAIGLQTALSPAALLHEILAIEKSLGRYRHQRFGPRLIDIDILFYENAVIETETLSVPHPQLALRRFVLVPLVEIAPTLVHPVLHKTMAQLLAECPDKLAVQKFRGVDEQRGFILPPLP